MIDFKQYAADVLDAVDRKDVTRFTGFLADDCRFVFGNADPVVTRNAISGYVDRFLSQVRKTVHHLLDVWQVDDVIIMELRVTYTRHDTRELTFPAVNIWRIENDRITDYRIYIDNSSLFRGSGDTG